MDEPVETREVPAGYEPPRLTVHGTVKEATAAAHAGPSMDHHFPANGRPGVSH